jgi:hypothetical protein
MFGTIGVRNLVPGLLYNHFSKGTPEQVMTDQIEFTIINPRVVQKDKNGLCNGTTGTCPLLYTWIL